MWCITWWKKNYSNVDLTEESLLNKTSSWVKEFEVLSKQNREAEKLINVQEDTISKQNIFSQPANHDTVICDG